MNLPRFSIEHPVLTTMVMLISIVVGIVSLTSSPLELMPKIDPPIAVIIAPLPSASPQEVVSLLTEPLENAVATTSGLTNLSSASRESMALLMLQFNWGMDMNEARTDLRQAIDRVKLPEGAPKPSLIKFDPNMLPVIELSVTNGENLTDLKRLLEREIVPRLEKTEGVAAVFVTGAPDREIQVLLHQDKLKRYGLSQSQIIGAIQAGNLTYPAGRIAVADKHLNLRIVGRIDDAAELSSSIVGMAPRQNTAAAGPSTSSAEGGMPAGSNQQSLGLPLPAGMEGATLGGALGAMGGAAVPSGMNLNQLLQGLGAAGKAPAAASEAAYRAVRLGDVAEIKETYAETTVINRTNGRPSLHISIQKEGEAYTVDVARAVQRELAKIGRERKGLEIVTMMDQGEIITRSVRNVVTSLLGGAVLALLVLLVFLRNLRPTLIIGLAIPFSVIVTFVLIYLNKMTMNIMTLGGLALGVGMLVDNAIVVIENIYRRLDELGEDPRQASERGTNEVAGAITSSTLTTVAVFLPVVFVGGLTGEIFKELALTVTFSLLASLAVALTVVPMLASRFLKAYGKGARTGIYVTRVNAYTRALGWVLRHRAVTIGAVLVLLAASLFLAPHIGTEFIPSQDEGAFSITVRMPPGTALAVTAAGIEEMARVVERNVPVHLVTTSAGTEEGLAGLSSAVGGGGDGSIKVLLEEDYPRPTTKAMRKVEQALAEVKGKAVLTLNLDTAMAMSGGSGSQNVQVNISGPEPAEVRRLVRLVQRAIVGVKGVSNVTSNLDNARPELQVLVDGERAMQKGLTAAQVAFAVADAVKGRIVTRIGPDGAPVDVRVVYRPQDRDSVAKVKNLLLKSALGQSVTLHQVARVQEALGPISITRENQRTSAQVKGLLSGSDLGSASTAIDALVKKLDIPAGYTVKLGGASQMMNEGFSGLYKALLMAIVLIYMIMAAQFESFLHPFTIMFTMPLAIVGVILGLFLGGQAMGITALIGIIILAGIVVNNGIVLVDFINQRRRGGLALMEAIIEAGRTRLRPILMTALTTVLGLLPLALGISEGTEIQAPMAVTVMGGLTTATGLTLFVVPVMYHLFAAGGKRGEETVHE